MKTKLLPIVGLLMLMSGCKVTWLGQSEPLDAMMLKNEKTGVKNVVSYGFMHAGKNKGYIVWRTVPRGTNQCAVPNQK